MVTNEKRIATNRASIKAVHQISRTPIELQLPPTYDFKGKNLTPYGVLFPVARC
jgi:hypothetical protein